MEDKKRFLTFCDISEYDRREFEKQFREEETEYEANKRPVRSRREFEDRFGDDVAEYETIERPVQKKSNTASLITGACVIAAVFFALGRISVETPSATDTYAESEAVSSEYVSTVLEQTESVRNESITDIMNHNVGDIVNFGKYEWYIISKTQNGVTMLCESHIDMRAYNNEKADITWENCTLRQWLNEDFYDQFTDKEKTYIAKTTCENKDNSKYGTDGGNNTEDYVFLLSLDEAEEVDESILTTGKRWWLRSPGASQNDAATVINDGSLYDFGYYVNGYQGVRPALNLEF